MSASAPRVIHTGQALVDLTIAIPDLPVRGQNVMAASVAQYAGGRDPGAAFAQLSTEVRDEMLACTGIWTSNGEEATDLLAVPG